jgi:transposase InsO family protein
MHERHWAQTPERGPRRKAHERRERKVTPLPVVEKQLGPVEKELGWVEKQLGRVEKELGRGEKQVGQFPAVGG